MDKQIDTIIEEIKKNIPVSPVFYITFTDKPGSYTSSKIGGSYYWPDDHIPELKFLAQINFSELPENTIFPKEGLLQFFIRDDDSWGLFGKQPGWKVVFHEQIGDGVKIDQEWPEGPVEKESWMQFELTSEMMTYQDNHFDDYLPKQYRHYSENEDLFDKIWEIFFDEHSKLLGYPIFSQWDPRDKFDRSILLFQLCSDREGHIMWGDYGVGNFFITEEDLKNRDFSKVTYNWDCY